MYTPRARSGVLAVMRAVRLLASVGLIGAGALPYAAPALCSIADSAMTAHDNMDAGNRHAASVGADTMNAQCDFAACALAPAAPPVTPMPIAIAFGTTRPVIAAPTVGPGPAVAPLTPPPLS